MSIASKGQRALKKLRSGGSDPLLSCAVLGAGNFGRVPGLRPGAVGELCSSERMRAQRRKNDGFGPVGSNDGSPTANVWLWRTGWVTFGRAGGVDSIADQGGTQGRLPATGVTGIKQASG
jgi:hypothetical protein